MECDVQRLDVTTRSGRCTRTRMPLERLRSARHSRCRSVWITAAVRQTVQRLTSTWLSNPQPAGYIGPGQAPCT